MDRMLSLCVLEGRCLLRTALLSMVITCTGLIAASERYVLVVEVIKFHCTVEIE